MGFYDGMGDASEFQNQTPRLTTGEYLVEITETSLRRSEKDKSTQWLQVNFRVEESNSTTHPVDTEACVQIFEEHKWKYHLKKMKALVLAALPSVLAQRDGSDQLDVYKARLEDKTGDRAAKFAQKMIDEGFLVGAKLRVVVAKNKGGYDEPAYEAA